MGLRNRRRHRGDVDLVLFFQRVAASTAFLAGLGLWQRSERVRLHSWQSREQDLYNTSLVLCIEKYSSIVSYVFY